MKVSIIQLDIKWAAPKDNVANAERLMLSAPKSDLYVLPEMFSTGFATQPEGIAESDDSETLRWMISMSKRLNAAIAGSVAVKSNGKFYNRFYFVNPDTGVVSHYDKHHLFTYGGEHLRFTAGNERVTLCYRGVRFLLQVCYDLRFPVYSRSHGGDYDAILYVASWPKSRVEPWSLLLKARAIENQCFVIGVNRVGDDPNCHYSGASAVVDAYGKPLAECGEECEVVKTAEMDMEGLQAFRKKFPVLNDADMFQLG